MQLILERYGTSGPTASGVLFISTGQHICHTLELPWNSNSVSASCVPSGLYNLVIRTGEKFGRRVHLEEVPNRTGILFHAANNAISELKGCIAPVTHLTGPYQGLSSRRALQRLENIVMPELEAGKVVELFIK